MQWAPAHPRHMPLDVSKQLCQLNMCNQGSNIRLLGRVIDKVTRRSRAAIDHSSPDSCQDTFNYCKLSDFMQRLLVID